MDLESFQFDDEEIYTNLMSVEPPPAPAAEEIGNSFTALLDLPPNEAVKLLHSPEKSKPNVFASVFPVTEMENSPETTTNSFDLVKQEPVESDSMRNSSPIFSDLIVSKSTKRKDREKKVKSSTAKKMKSFATESDDGEKLPYVHVRARRGEATDSHSLAERARREKINARMKLLQELVPGCNKIAGTAMVLDEIINHVQSLQLQVELLSMKLAAVYPTIDINLDHLFPSESGSSMDYNFTGMVSPSWGVDGQENVITQSIWHHDELNTLMTPDNSMLSYDCSGNSASWLTSQLKMEL